MKQESLYILIGIILEKSFVFQISIYNFAAEIQNGSLNKWLAKQY